MEQAKKVWKTPMITTVKKTPSYDELLNAVHQARYLLDSVKQEYANDWNGRAVIDALTILDRVYNKRKITCVHVIHAVK